ncbi:uncharacterized protein LOC108852652 isoform X2 [Raphanus sativus]|uniref:Uncharacterized protein LOC108852652 isoform X2 n=1 Tax=Raphanus sativus TaxID=3726 RepID=A0A6J0NBV3_RAPSA|nr:uncharacterized protein LOC108852652 isoform X2 [Raphanus sativus]
MGESAVLFHSHSFAAPSSRHEDNTIHALSQSVSFGRFATENLEWGKWSSFSHKKYVDEAEKYSQPGSVAQKKAFFDAHYKRIAEAKKAKQAQPESVEVLLKTLETLTNQDEVKEEQSGETELVLGGEEDVVEANTVIEEDGLQAVIEVLDGLEENERSAVEEEVKSVTKNSSLHRSEAPDKPMELVVTRKTSENLMNNKEKPVRQRFSLLKLLMGNTKTQRQNSKKTDKKPMKPFLCLCFNSDVVGETKGPTKTQRRNL